MINIDFVLMLILLFQKLSESAAKISIYETGPFIRLSFVWYFVTFVVKFLNIHHEGHQGLHEGHKVEIESILNFCFYAIFSLWLFHLFAVPKMMPVENEYGKYSDGNS